ncbi:MAG TPA: Txe/YoeB family addiction module toxin [Saprospiraceae bacterium]|nr:Txe/YoeB family addiction module toxin [Saprospiraceae bacterium]HQW56299.1 Txe/YoeB family addiction module toxin [Saprospiraceae bacterium]
MSGYTLRFSEQAKEDIRQHKKSGNKSVVNKIILLLEELVLHPFTGTGKPEPLKHSLAGCWSRRINKEHRLVYDIIEGNVLILSAKGHYL